MSRMGLWAGLLLFLPVAVIAAEPESLPAPRSLTPPPVVQVPPMPQIPIGHPRVSDYEHWQNYGITRSGRFRPLVITLPDGMYYRYNGAPYPYAIVHPDRVMSYVTN
jgi:hypothetical protein